MKNLINDDEINTKINYSASKLYFLASPEAKNMIDGLETLYHGKEINRKLSNEEEKVKDV